MLKNKDVVLTIFTPTYNRESKLGILYESLKRQTNMNFEWLIVDDGSTDQTKKLVDTFLNDSRFKIIYKIKENGGKHTAINYMLDIVETPLVCIVDSDDFLVEDAVETICRDYLVNKDNKSICEYIYLRMFNDKKIIGKMFEREGILNPIDDIVNKSDRGDKCNVILVEKFKLFRFPKYKLENFMGESVLWNKVYNNGWNVFVKNKAIYSCEYLKDGLTMGGRKMRILQPLGGMEYANSLLAIKELKKFYKVKRIIQYICYGFFANKSIKNMYNNINCKTYFGLCITPGWILYKYWKYKCLK